MNDITLLIFGAGYCGSAIAEAARGQARVVLVSRRSEAAGTGMERVDFAAAAPALARATHLVATAAPDAHGDPVLARYRSDIIAAPALRWIGYLSSTGVYGNRDGGWVDEDDAPAPDSARAATRLAAEQEWEGVAAGRALDLFRLAGIYGPGRSAFDDIAAGRARRVIKPGHQFGRIHRDDIVQAVLAAMRQPGARRRVLNLADDVPAESAVVLEEAARLLGVAPPPAVPFAQALPAMSPMARSFWADNRRVASVKTQAALGLAWRYPSYREGLRAILAEQRSQNSGQ
jgi:nucleoside-diphosphate-sugar epimerase